MEGIRNGVPFVNGRSTKGVSFLPKMVYKSVRGRTSGRSLSRRSSAILCSHRWILVNLRTVPTNSNVFLSGLLTMRENQILTSVIEIQKEKWG